MRPEEVLTPRSPRSERRAAGSGLGEREEISTLPVLIDTSVWVAYFQKEERTFREVNALMDSGRVCSADRIVGELLHASHSDEEMKVLQDFTRIFPILGEPPEAWVKAARLSFSLRRKGKELTLRDAYLAVIAESHGALIYTQRKPLRQARRALGSSVKFFSPRRTGVVHKD